MTTGAVIVVVDDEPDIRRLVIEYLGRHGYSVEGLDGGAALRARVAAGPADLVVLDVNMPGEDGLSLARWLREQTAAAVIMLTANSATVDRVVGLEIGADDYLTKPFDLRELLARVRSVLRRTARPVAAVGAAGERVPVGRHVLDLAARRLLGADGAEVPLTAMEFDLLAALARRPGRVLSRAQLLDLAHNREVEPFDRSIDIRIARLRAKIEDDPTKPRVIKTVRGAGYVFAAEADDGA